MSWTVIIDSIGWTLVHSVWVLLVPALFLSVFLRCFPKAASKTRYGVALLAMFSIPVLVAPIIWLCWQPAGNTESVVHSEETLTSVSMRPAPVAEAQQLNLPEPDLQNSPPSDAVPQVTNLSQVQLPERPQASVAVVEEPTRPIAVKLRPWLPTLVGIWVVGVALFSIRTVLGIRVTRRLSQEGLSKVDDHVMDVFQHVARKLNVPAGVRLMQSTLVQVPSVVGHFTPIVLLPASALTGLSTKELQAVIAHELAHVRRHDYLINVLQRSVESLLFYHPAVWWVSSVVRSEREYCCDDVALSVCKEKSSLARALMLVNQQAEASRSLAVAANGGQLVKRIRRIVVADNPSNERSWAAGLITLSTLVTAIILVAATIGTTAAVVAKDDPLTVDDSTSAPQTVAWPKQTPAWLDLVPDRTKGHRFAVSQNRWIEIVAVGTTDEKPIFWSPDGVLMNAPEGFDTASMVPDPVDGSIFCDRQVIVRIVSPKGDGDPFLVGSGSSPDNVLKFEEPIDDHYRQLIVKLGLKRANPNHAWIEYGYYSDEFQELPHDIPTDVLTAERHKWCDVVKLQSSQVAVVTATAPDGYFQLHATNPSGRTATSKAPSKTTMYRGCGIEELDNGRRLDSDWVTLFDISHLPDADSFVVERKRNLRSEIQNISIYPGPKSKPSISTTGKIDPSLTLIERDKSKETTKAEAPKKLKLKTVRGKVTSPGRKPIPAAWVGVFVQTDSRGFFEPKRRLIGEGTTDAAGIFRFEVEDMGDNAFYSVWSVTKDGTSALTSPQSLERLDVSMLNESGDIFVLGPDEKPVSGATLSLEAVKKRRGFTSYVPNEVASRIELKTNKDGKAILKGWPAAGIKGIAVTTKAYGTQYLSSGRVGEWADGIGLTLKMKPTFIVTGKIQGFDPGLHRGLRLMASTFEYGRGVPILGRAVVSVDNNGFFAIPNLAKGRLSWENSLSPTSASKLQLPKLQIVPAGKTLRQHFPILPATMVRQRLVKKDTGEPAIDTSLRVLWGASANGTSDNWGESVEVKTDANGWWQAQVAPGRINVRYGYPRGYRQTGWFDGRVDRVGIPYDIPQVDQIVVLPEEQFVREETVTATLVHDDGSPAIGWQLYGRPLTWRDVGTGGVPGNDKGEYKIRYPKGYPPRLFEAKNDRWLSDYNYETDSLRAKVISRVPLRLEIPSATTAKQK